MLSHIEKLSGYKLNVAEVTQSEIGQKQKLQTVLEAVHGVLRPLEWNTEWSVDCEHHTHSLSAAYILIYKKSYIRLLFFLSHSLEESGFHRLPAAGARHLLHSSHPHPRARVRPGDCGQGMNTSFK